MSGYKFKFDEMRENDPTENKAAENTDHYYSESNVRNLCFVWPDGRMKFLNYAYLVSGEYSPIESIITLVFTSEKIILKGLNLEILFKQLVNHLPKQLTCFDVRYNTLNKGKTFQINEINIEKNNS